MTHFVQTLISGLSLGSIYALIALGYTMVYGIAKMLNFAHGDVIMVGAYICFYAVTRFSLPPLVGVVLEWIRRDMKTDPALMVERTGRMLQGDLRRALCRLASNKIHLEQDG